MRSRKWFGAMLLVMVVGFAILAAGCGSEDGSGEAAPPASQPAEEPATPPAEEPPAEEPPAEGTGGQGEILQRVLAAKPPTLGPRGEGTVPDVELTEEEIQQLAELDASGTIKIGQSDQIASVDFWKQVDAAFLATIQQYLPNAEVIITDAELKPEKQISDIEGLLAQGVNVLSVTPVDSFAVVSILQQVVESGTPLVVGHSKVGSGTEVAYQGWCGSDSFQGGWEAGAYLADFLGGQGEVASVSFPFDLWHTRLRNEGFEQAALAGGLTIKEKGQALANDEGAALFENMLTRSPDLVGGFALWDGPALGMAQAAAALGRDDVAIVAHDVTEPTALEIKNGGLIRASSAQQTDKLGEICGKVVLKALLGQDLSATPVVIPTVLTTPENVDAVYEQLYGKPLPQ